MDVELLRIGVKVRKGVMFTIRGCLRSAWNHPFLVGILCFLIFLYRLSPFMFQLLVSASPILVCTAVLLGTILSFGQPNIPEIEVEDESTVKESVVEKNDGYYRVEREEFNDTAPLIEERSVETELNDGDIGGLVYEQKSDWIEERLNNENVERSSRVERDKSDDTAPLIEERSVETELNAGEIGDLVYEQKSDWIEEKLKNESYYVEKDESGDTTPLIEERSVETKFNNDGGIGEGRRDLGDLVYEQKSDWIDRFNNGEIKENYFASPKEVNDDDDDDVESDDEKSEADSFGSEKVNVDSLDSPPHSPWARRVEDEEEDDDEGSDSESSRAESSSPDASMADILPMLDELHPLLDEQVEHPQIADAASEKSSESEHQDDDNEDEEGNKEEDRNPVIAWTKEDEKNLMDLGSSELERNRRLENLILRRRARKMFADKNLIDLDGAELPFNIAPISTRRPNNPFDPAHDNNSGLPPIPGSAPSVLSQRRNPFDIPYDSSEEKPDLMVDGFKEEFSATSQPIFRRHESFNVGPSNLAPKRKMRPYFVPEGSVLEESSYSVFQRQLSEVSESKLSSVPDSESISSVTSAEDQEEDNLLEVEVIADMKEEDPSEDSELIYHQEVELEENVHGEAEMVSIIESVSEHVGHGSDQSSDEEDSFELRHVENRDAEFIELVDHSYNEQRYTRDSSSSSLSEVSERVFTMTEEGRNDFAEAPHVSNETSLENTINDGLHSVPIYDTSPREVSSNISSSLISSDVHPQRESEGNNLEMETDIQCNTELLTDGASVEEHLVEQHIWDEVPVSNADMNIDSMAKSPEDQNLEESVEDSYPLLSTHSQVEVSEPSFEGQLRIDHLVGAEETVLHEPNFMHFNDVQASSTSMESLLDNQATQDLSMPEVQEPDHYISSNFNSPSSPEFVAIPSNAFEETTCFDEQKIIEVGGSNKIDDMLLSELDSVGDFSNSRVFDKHIYSVGEENLSSLHETSFMSSFKVHSVEMHQIEDSLLPSDSIEHVDLYKEDVKLSSEPQTSETSRGENIDSPRVESEVQHVANLDYEHMFSTVFQPVGPVEGIDVVPPEKEGSTSVVTEIISTQGQVHNDTTSAMLELEACTNEKIEQISSKEIEQSVVLEQPQAEFLLSQDVDTDVRIPSGIPSLEANKVEDKEIEKPVVSQPPQGEKSEIQSGKDVDAVSEKAELIIVGTEVVSSPLGMPKLVASTIRDIDLDSDQISFNEIKSPVEESFTIPAMPESEVQSTKHVDLVTGKGEFTSLETDANVGLEAFSQVQVDADTDSGMTELNASTVENMDMAFEEIISTEIENIVVLESHNHEVTVSGVPDQSTHVDVLQKDKLPSEVAENTDTGMPVLEARAIKDIDLEFEQIRATEIEKPAEQAVGETATENSEDHRDLTVTTVETLDHMISGETQGTSDDTILSPKKVLDGETTRQLKPNEDDGKEGSHAAEKAAHDCKSSEDSSQSPSSGKGKASKDSSSSSSSESNSSSSDSD